MAFCKKCGTQLADGAPACPSCGELAATEAQQPQQPTYQQQPVYQQPMYATPDQDAVANKTMGILAYIGILVLVPIFSENAKRSPFARFHANQGLVLCILDIALMIVASIVGAIFTPRSLEALYYYAVGGGSIVPSIIWLIAGAIILVLSIMGIVNAVNGRTKPLPIIGGIKILK